MTNYLAKKRIAREWNANREVKFISYADAKHIVILTEALGLDQLRSTAENWQKDGKDVTWVIYANSTTPATLPGRIIPIHKRFGGLLSLPSAKETELFDAIKPDTLIDISQGKHIALQFLAAHSKAPMKIGIVDTAQQNPPFDLIIRRNDSPGADILLQEIVSYWTKIGQKTIHKKDNTGSNTDL